MACPKGNTVDGFETQIGTNHFGHFLLVNLLLDKIKASAPSRIVVLSSAAHKMAKGINFEDINSTKSYSAWGAYGQSKLANILFARELANRLKAEGINNVYVGSVHPGVIHTDLGRHMKFSSLFYALGYFFMKSIPQGAATTTFVATNPSVLNYPGEYFADCNLLETTTAGKDLEAAKKLWEYSEKVTGLSKETEN